MYKWSSLRISKNIFFPNWKPSVIGEWILFLTIDQAQLINWTNLILDIVTNCIEVSLRRANHSLWTNLVKGNSGIDGSEDQVSNTWILV